MRDTHVGGAVAPDSFVRLMGIITFVSILAIVIGLWTRHTHPSEPREGLSTLPRSSGAALVAIYIGSSDCHGSSLPGFPAVEHRTMAALGAYAQQHGMRFVRIGVAVDASSEVGRAYLQRLGPFDMMSVGGGWLNPVAISYLWRDQPSDGTIPQIVVLRRIVKIASRGPLVGADSLLGRLVGIDGMEQWLRRNSG
jgi:hypothetical protein